MQWQTSMDCSKASTIYSGITLVYTGNKCSNRAFIIYFRCPQKKPKQHHCCDCCSYLDFHPFALLNYIRGIEFGTQSCLALKFSIVYIFISRRKWNLLLFVKGIQQKPNGLWPLCHSETEWGLQGKEWCPLRGASSLATWDKEKLKAISLSVVEEERNRHWNTGLLLKRSNSLAKIELNSLR